MCSSPPDPPWLKGALVGVLYRSTCSPDRTESRRFECRVLPALSPVRPPPFPSELVGVGHSSRNHEPASRLRIDGAPWFAFAVVVCNKPEPVAAVRGAKG